MSLYINKISLILNPISHTTSSQLSVRGQRRHQVAKPQVAVKRIELMLSIREVSSSNLGWRKTIPIFFSPSRRMMGYLKIGHV
jgi:hypothetical protein